ncbi:MAG: dihydrofolate reductase [Bacteroidota bacterium]
MNVSMIAAMGSNRVIGKDNDIPWSLPDDFKFFRDTTKGHHVIMGRKNWESLPHKFKPLPYRTNIIITRQEKYIAEGAIVVASMEDALQVAEKDEQQELFIIGGGEIYQMALPLANKIYLTEIHQDFKGSVFFPNFSQETWKEISRVKHQQDEKHAYAFDFVQYNRIEK